MNRVSGKVLWTVAALAIVVAVAEVADAQREGRQRGGRGGFGMRGGQNLSAVQLAAESEEVQAALNLTDDQTTKVAEINDQLRDDFRDLRGQGGGGFAAMREEREKLSQDASAKLAEVLNEEQQTRLLGIMIQVNGANALLEPRAAKELTLSDDQTAKLIEARDENWQAMMDSFRDFQDLSQEERRDKMQELRSESDERLLAVLTDDQKEKYEALKGEPVEIDMGQFRRGRGGFGGGGRGGRNRDN